MKTALITNVLIFIFKWLKQLTQLCRMINRYKLNCATEWMLFLKMWNIRVSIETFTYHIYLYNCVERRIEFLIEFKFETEKMNLFYHRKKKYIEKKCKSISWKQVFYTVVFVLNVIGIYSLYTLKWWFEKLSFSNSGELNNTGHNFDKRNFFHR